MRILITAGPTREYLDDVRYLSNASSGRMGYALAEAVLAAGHEVILVSGPVALTPPVGCEFHAVETTEQMRNACVTRFAVCGLRRRDRGCSGLRLQTSQPDCRKNLQNR